MAPGSGGGTAHQPGVSPTELRGGFHSGAGARTSPSLFPCRLFSQKASHPGIFIREVQSLSLLSFVAFGALKQVSDNMPLTSQLPQPSLSDRGVLPSEGVGPVTEEGR